MPLRNAVQIGTDVEHIYAYAPTYGLNSAHPAAIDTDHTLYNLDKADAELLARTVAPHLFPTEGLEPWRTPVREIYADLAETEQSYRRDLQASQSAETPWTVEQIGQSLAGLLGALQVTLEKLEELL